MTSFKIDGKSPPIDIVHELREHRRGCFWIERGKSVLEIHGVEEGGHWCEITDKHAKAGRDALGPGGPGLVNTRDAAGEPFVVRRACALPQKLAVAVIKAFVRDGSRSDAVRWGHGVVRDSWGYRWRGDDFVEYDEVEWLEELDDGGLLFSFTQSIPPSHGKGPVWDAITELDITFEGGLKFLAKHPMADLRSLNVTEEGLSLASLPAVLAAHPALEELWIRATPAVKLAQLSAPHLRDLWILTDSDVGDEELQRMTEKIEKARERWQLPALRKLHVSRSDDDGEDEDDDDDDD